MTIEDIRNEQALIWHLRYNNYPAFPLSFLPVAKDAIAAYNRCEYDEMVSLHNAPIQYQGGTHAPARELIDLLNLQWFVESEDYDFLMHEIDWTCPTCGTENWDSQEHTVIPVCGGCGESFDWNEVT